MEEGLFYISNCFYVGGVGYCNSILLWFIVFIIIKGIYVLDIRFVYICVNVLIFLFVFFIRFFIYLLWLI